MNAKSFIIKHTISIVVALVIIIIGFLIFGVRTIVDDAVIESTFDEMEQIGKQYQTLLVSTLVEAQEDLILLADSIAQNDMDSNTAIDFFNNQLQTNQFECIYYITLDGNGISADNIHYNFSDNQSFLHALENKTYIEEPHISLQTSDIVFDLAVPIIKNNQTVAVLFSEVSVDNFWEIILQNKDYEGDVFFIDNNLNIIFSTSESHLDVVVIPEEDVAQMGPENILQAQTNIQNKQSGGFYYEYFDIPKVMVYYPIEFTDIALAMNVHVSSLSSEMIKASNYFEVAGIFIYITIISLVIYVTIFQSRSNKRIMKVAYYDPLTELPNMTKLRLDVCAVLQNNPKTNYSIIVIDIENFKAINEMFGYDIGDNVLKTVKSLAESFNEPSLIAARIGSDKFALFAGNGFFDDLSFFAQAVDSHYNKLVPELAEYGGTFKIGRYHIEIGETNFDDIMSKVNLAHLKAKATKGEFVCDYDDTLKNQVKTDADITSKMNNALHNQEFKVYLQPKFSAHDNTLIGAEALVRWIEYDGNMIFPNDFIPLFERNGFIVDLDNYILENVCIRLKSWLDEGFGQMPISVNCSRLNLENPYFVDGLVEIVDKYQIPHEYIEIELTESTTIETAFTIEQLFADLHKHGFKISIDDFGAGYSSLGMLKSLHIDTLKMDRSFFVGGTNARRDDMLIDSIVKMAHNLGMYVVAEGIETAEQVELLKSLNCDAIQGYFYDRPTPLDVFEEKYRAMMIENANNKTSGASIIKWINDIKYASSFAPSGLIVTLPDEEFTIVEANDYYFEMIGYTREEVRDLFANQGLGLMTAESKKEIKEYVLRQMQIDPYAPLEINGQLCLKSGEIHTYQFNGKLAVNENGDSRFYASVFDVTDFAKLSNLN